MMAVAMESQGANENDNDIENVKYKTYLTI